MGRNDKANMKEETSIFDVRSVPEVGNLTTVKSSITRDNSEMEIRSNRDPLRKSLKFLNSNVVPRRFFRYKNV